MKLSIIIVNYNVEYFLEQCLLSVEKAIAHLDADVYVVDNQSVDGSCAMVQNRFPWVKLIANKDNVGFSKANNQAMVASNAEYVLLLNPDTVVEEDTFHKVVDFMDVHQNAGGLGVRMVDGKGTFLPESKRGLPTPWVSFCKISGIYRVFPRTKKFNHYYMGYLSEHETNKVEILSGAFMMMRKTALEKVGLLDEAFFMYGEDIDLSWRIIQGGYENYYFPETRIIHYKGESTKKGSLNYVFVFYQAMIIFARKHFSTRNAKLFSSLINLAIYARAAVAVISRFVKQVWLPLLDAALLLLGVWLMKEYYADVQHKIFDSTLTKVALTGYTLVWMLSVFFSGGYDRPLSMFKIIRGALIGGVLVLLGYSLFPEDWRFSRALVLLGGAWSVVYYVISRVIFNMIAPSGFAWEGNKSKRYAIVGSSSEINRIEALLIQTRVQEPWWVGVAPDGMRSDVHVGEIDQLEEVLRVHGIDEVIFSGKDVSSAQTIDIMSKSSSEGLEYKIAPSDTLYMIGSNSIDSNGDLFMLEANGVHKSANKRNKRVFDALIALTLLISLPFSIFFVKRKLGFLQNIFKVSFGLASWVGYAEADMQPQGLPTLRKAALSAALGLPPGPQNQDTLKRMNLIYARDYRVRKDFILLVRHFKHLGDRVR